MSGIRLKLPKYCSKLLENSKKLSKSLTDYGRFLYIGFMNKFYRRLFFHGGPGLNSNCESKQLAKFFDGFWNEPSLLRPRVISGHLSDNRFENLIEDAWTFIESQIGVRKDGNSVGVFREENRGRLSLVCHSFSVWIPVLLALRAKNDQRCQAILDSIGEVVLVSPVLDTLNASQRILSLAAVDLLASNPAVAAKITAAELSAQFAYDEIVIAGFRSALLDEMLFTHYFSDMSALQLYAQALSDPGFGVDVESLFAVMAGFHAVVGSDTVEIGIASLQSLIDQKIKLTFVVGEHDKIANSAKNREYFERLSFGETQGKFEVIRSVGHFGHLENPKRFEEILGLSVRAENRIGNGKNHHPDTCTTVQ